MADILSVSNAQELRSALNNAKGGETIELAGGDYGKLELITFKTFGVKAIYDSPVTITSADPDDRASFSGMDLREVKNLTFDNVIFDSNYAGSKIWVAPFKVYTSEGLTIRNSLFEGELASGTGDPTTDGFAIGKGLQVLGGSSNLVIENNEFTTWHTALSIGGASDIRVTGNDIHSSRSEGMNFSNVHNIVIEDNYIHDFVTSKASGDHADMIQFWNHGGRSTDIVIRGNTLDVGKGDHTQSLFMRNEVVDNGGAGKESFYQNLLIEENVILNNHHHGISIGQTNGLIIRKNSVLDADATDLASVKTPRINVNSESTNVVIEQNVTAAIRGQRDQSDWTVSDNALVQNTSPDAPSYYATEFITSSTSGEANGYVANPNGSIAQLEAGASRLQLDTSPENLMAAFEVANNPDDATALVFDAGHTYGATGEITASEAQFVWDFGDGTEATGQIVRHTYAEAGRYDATLTVVRPDGATATAESEIAIMGADMLSFDPQTGFFQTEGYGEVARIENSDRGSVSIDNGYGIDLGGGGIATRVGKSDIARLFGAENFDMSMTLRADTLGSTGEVARVHTHFILSVAKRGEIDLLMWTENWSKTKLQTTGVTVNDGADHDIRIAFDSAASRLEIHVDGALVAATDVDGTMRDTPRELDFGSPWSKQNFDGTLTAFNLAVDKNDYPDYVGDALPGNGTDAGNPAQDDTPQTTAPDEQDAQEDSGTPEEVPTSEDHTEAPVDDTPLPPDETETQDPTVVVDAEGDRIEVILDDDTTPDTPDPDPVPVASDPVRYVRGGEISTAWARHFDSDINDIQDAEVFVDDAATLIY